jgi:hypothetical protein
MKLETNKRGCKRRPRIRPSSAFHRDQCPPPAGCIAQPPRGLPTPQFRLSRLFGNQIIVEPHGPGRLRLSLRRLVFRSELRQKSGKTSLRIRGGGISSRNPDKTSATSGRLGAPRVSPAPLLPKSTLSRFAERLTQLVLDVEVRLQPDCSSNERPRSAFR